MLHMDIEALERDAKIAAAKHVANMLQRPDQLEKVEQYRKRVERKKASVEGLLKNAMQTQLDGVRTGLVHLKTSLRDIQEVKKTVREVEETFPVVPNLVDRLKYVREESMRHSQYAAAMENLRHIFDVPETVKKTRDHISDAKLLLAHQSLTELENSRDDLLFEMHRLPATSSADKNMLKHYFSDVEKLSEELGKQLWLIVRLTLNSVRKEPQIIVTALRIVEREEKSDAMAKKRHDQSGFVTPGRPKNWRKRVFEILEEAATERIVGNQLEDRSQNKMWLVRHLEVTRQLIKEDMRVVKTACVPCFPPHYDIVRSMLELYHRCLSSHLQDCALQLEGNEFVTLLTWVQIYEGPDLMAHPDLGFDLKEEGFEPLLPRPLIDDLTNKYVATIERNYKEWMNNTIVTEMKDWGGSSPPDADDAGHYQTTTPVIVFQMIDEHLQVAKTVHQFFVNRVLIISMEHLATFARQYNDAVGKHSKSHFEDRRQYKYFTPYKIAIANNCINFSEIAQKFSQQYRSVANLSDQEADKVFENVLTSFDRLRVQTIDVLLHELFLDVDCELSKVGTKDWLDGKHCVVENVCLTLDDYFSDYEHLKERNFETLKSNLQNKLAKGYITALLQKKMVLKEQSQREQFAKRFVKEADILKSHLGKYVPQNPSATSKESPFDALSSLSEFIVMKDLSMLFLEVSGLVKRYPDITGDHFVALLSLREDMAKTNIRKQVMEMMPDLGGLQGPRKTIFSDIHVNV
ncbi:Exocyst complex component 3 [Halotydeus destructor]|nr:Exocyst complex component 3 [Halotydeus destructor]